MSDWRPIDTAPMDGTDVLVTDGEWQQVAARHLSDRRWRVWTAALHDPPLTFKPTHWQPLPDPPETPDA